MATRKTTSLTESQARTIIRRALKNPPIITEQYVDDVERVFRPDSTLSVARRLGTVMASKDAAFLLAPTEN